VIIQTCSAGPAVEGTACVSATNGCIVRSEEGHVPWCTHGAATVMAVTAELIYVCVGVCVCTADYTKQVSMHRRRHKTLRYIKTQH
jgi:hypothetical protein